MEHAAAFRVDQHRTGAVLRDGLEAWGAAERGRFVLWLPVLMIAGAAAYFTLRFEPPPWYGPAATVVAAAVALACRGFRLARAAALAMAAVALGFASGQFATWRALPLDGFPHHAVQLTATVRGVEMLPAGRRLVLSGVRLTPGTAELPRGVRVRLRGNDTTLLSAGDRVSLRAMIWPPPPPAWPGAWDLQRDSFFNGTGGYGYALGAATVMAHAAPGGIFGWWRGVRDAVGRRVMAELPGPEGTIAATLLTGIPTAIPAADRAAFRDSGLAHLLAVAGLHLGLVMGLVFGLVRLGLALWEHAALFWPTKQIAALAALAAGLFYMLLTGAHVPILRSFAMAALVTLGLIAGRRALSLRALALAATALVLLAPQEVTGVSFQMSFAAVLALIAGYDALRPWLLRLHGSGGAARRIGLHLVALALTSILAGTASAPFGAFHFGHIQLYFVLANMAAVPIAAFCVMPAGLVALTLMPLGLERLALLPMGWGIAAILWIARRVAAMPAATLAVPHPPGWGLVLVALGIAWLGLWRTRVRLLGLLPLLCGLLSPAMIVRPALLVSANARLIGFHAEDAMFVQRHGGSAFTLDSWQAFWAAPAPVNLPATGMAGQGRVRCDPVSCLLRPAPGGPAALLVRDPKGTIACAKAVVLISAEPLRHLCPALPRVDRFSVWRNGATAIWLGADDVRVLTDRQMRGARPWVPPLPVSRARKQPALPMAQRESLPAQ